MIFLALSLFDTTEPILKKLESRFSQTNGVLFQQTRSKIVNYDRYANLNPLPPFTYEAKQTY